MSSEAMDHICIKKSFKWSENAKLSESSKNSAYSNIRSL